MIASTFEQLFWPVGALVASLGALALAGRGWRLRRRSEFERQLLELLHLATRRQVPLDTMLLKVAADARPHDRVRLERIAARLSEGATLQQALSTSAPGYFAQHTLAALGAAEGTAQLSAALGDLSRRSDRAGALKYRVLLAASYPTLLSLVALGLGAFWAFASWSSYAYDVPRVDLAPWVIGAALVWGCFWLLLVSGWGHGAWSRALAAMARRTPWLGQRLQLLPAARGLRACGSLIAAGNSLPNALRHAGQAAGDERYERGFADAAKLADSGAGPEEIWQCTNLPDFVVARLQALRGTPSRLAEALQGLAEHCEQRCADAVQRAIAFLQPVAVLGFGIVVVLQFSDLFTWIGAVREKAMEAMPW